MEMFELPLKVESRPFGVIELSVSPKKLPRRVPWTAVFYDYSIATEVVKSMKHSGLREHQESIVYDLDGRVFVVVSPFLIRLKESSFLKHVLDLRRLEFGQ